LTKGKFKFRVLSAAKASKHARSHDYYQPLGRDESPERTNSGCLFGVGVLILGSLLNLLKTS